MKSTKLVNALVDQLMDMGMPLTASSLEEIYQSDRFTKIDHLTFLSELI